MHPLEHTLYVLVYDGNPPFPFSLVVIAPGFDLPVWQVFLAVCMACIIAVLGVSLAAHIATPLSTSRYFDEACTERVGACTWADGPQPRLCNW